MAKQTVVTAQVNFRPGDLPGGRLEDLPGERVKCLFCGDPVGQDYVLMARSGQGYAVAVCDRCALAMKK